MLNANVYPKIYGLSKKYVLMKNCVGRLDNFGVISIT